MFTDLQETDFNSKTFWYVFLLLFSPTEHVPYVVQKWMSIQNETRVNKRWNPENFYTGG